MQQEPNYKGFHRGDAKNPQKVIGLGQKIEKKGQIYGQGTISSIAPSDHEVVCFSEAHCQYLFAFLHPHLACGCNLGPKAD